jgi:uncharacterized membrane protein YoaK (UPF0700 family)
MSRDELGQLALAVGLTALAGYVDAIGLLRLGNLFVSFMSGDSTQLAVAVSQARWMKAGEAGAIVLLFVLGVTLGRLVGVAAKAWRRPAVLASETALLILAAALGPATRLAFVPLVMAMGMQNAAVRQVGQSKAGLTYVTGALVNVGEKLADALSARTPEELWAWAPHFWLWFGLVIGALLGALAYRTFGINALLAAALAAAVFAVITARQAMREVEPRSARRQ